jgi:hypothetical protein
LRPMFVNLGQEVSLQKKKKNCTGSNWVSGRATRYRLVRRGVDLGTSLTKFRAVAPSCCNQKSSESSNSYNLSRRKFSNLNLSLCLTN